MAQWCSWIRSRKVACGLAAGWRQGLVVTLCTVPVSNCLLLTMLSMSGLTVADPAPTQMTMWLASVHQLTTAHACCNKVDDDVLHVHDAAVAALGYTMVCAPKDDKDSETGDKRPVRLSSMCAHMPACHDSAIPAPPMMTGMPNMLFSGLLSMPPSLALASTSNVSPRCAGLG